MCIQVERALIANYKSVRSNRHKIDKPIQMKHPSIQLDKRLFSNLTRESFKLSNGDGNHRSIVKFVTYPKFNELAEMYKMCDPKLAYDVETKTFHAYVPFLDIPTTPYEDSYLGVDLGMKRIATYGFSFLKYKNLPTRFCKASCNSTAPDSSSYHYSIYIYHLSTLP